MISNPYQRFLAAQLLLYWIALSSAVEAQITSDGTLTIPTTVATQDRLNFTISNGTQKGTNLFHSFHEFSIPTGGSASFNISPDIANIISRVTGKSISTIDGLLQTNGRANFFLLNPNGIIFGLNASLDINGSFLATTANSIVFADGTQFSATDPSTSPLLTLSVPVGLQFGKVANAIRLQKAILNMPTNQTIAFVGGDVVLEGAEVTAPGGRVEIGSVAGNNRVSLAPTDKGWTLGYARVQNFQDIQLSGQAKIDVTDVSPFLKIGDFGSGSVQLQGRQIKLLDGSKISSNTLGVLPSGSIELTASDSVELIGTSANGASSSNVNTTTAGQGQAGDIVIQTRQLIVRDSAIISTLSTLLPGLTDTPGNSGNLTIHAAESVEVSGSSPTAGSSALTVATKASGNAGNLEIVTSRLILQDGAKISAETSGSGQGGNIRIIAPDSLEVSGRGTDVVANEIGEIVRKTVPSSIVATSTGTGKAGNLNIETGQLTVRDGAEVTVNSFGGSRAGNLEIAADSILLDNQGKLTAETASGEGGNINLQVQNGLVLRNNSLISATAGKDRGGGNGGNIDINAQFILASPLENSDIIANAFTGRGGNIQLTAAGILGFEVLGAVTPFSDIAASSTLGQSGIVAINRFEVDPQSGLGKLPAEVIDPEKLVVQRCSDRGNLESSQFIITGRGGLPADPGEMTGTTTGLADLGDSSLQGIREGNRPPAKTISPTPSPGAAVSTPPMLEAQGWIADANGKVTLTTQASAVTPHSPGLTPPTCYGSRTSSAFSSLPAPVSASVGSADQ
jgi:filamentous hemagglutinin family protein